jgi:hypothetical protein
MRRHPKWQAASLESGTISIAMAGIDFDLPIVIPAEAGIQLPRLAKGSRAQAPRMTQGTWY